MTLPARSVLPLRLRHPSPNYANGVVWIAVNDEPTCRDRDEIMGQLTVVLLADLFGRDPEIVADDVIAAREAGCA